MRKTVTLDGIWEFAFSETASIADYPEKTKFSSMASVPGCFDILHEWYGKRGCGFYRKQVFTCGKVSLTIDGIGIEGTVFWDGKKIGELPVPYVPETFVFDAGELKDHELLIAVSNRYNNVVFSYYDFYAYGGIFGSVTLEELPDTYIEQFHIHTTDWKKREVEITVKASRFLRKTQTLVIDFDGKLQIEKEFSGRELTFCCTLKGFELWSPEHPAMHSAVITLGKDSIREEFGIRQIQAVKQELRLNGEKLILKGFNRHESHPEFGSAMPPSLMASDLHLAKSIGCNFIRGSHYLQRKPFLELCDRMGMLVWEESIGWDVKPPELYAPRFLAMEKRQVRKMVDVHFNHPCIIIWGFLNETDSQLPRTRRIISALYKAVHEKDDSRLVTYASNKYEKDCCMDIVDIVAMNPYPGWYDANFEDVSGIGNIPERLQKLGKAVPADKPLMISEIGAAALYGYHDGYGSRWTEEYQAALAEEVCRCVFSNPRYCGLSFWMFCDAKSYINGRVLGRPRGFNNKGFLDEYRRPKMAWRKAEEQFKK